MGLSANLKWFYDLVNHDAPWDIKRAARWNETIGAGTFPGAGTVVYYLGLQMTPEDLGNYAYGYIGCAIGFGMDILTLGSEYAAGFPAVGTPQYNNELADQKYIKIRYDVYFYGIRDALTARR